MTPRIGIASGACMECPILEMLPALRTSGAAGLEVGTPPLHFDPWQDHLVEAVGRELRATAFDAISIHAPFGAFLDLADPSEHHRQAAITAIDAAARALRALGGRLVVVHPSDLERSRHNVPQRLDDAVRSLQTVAANCARTGVKLVVESPLPHLIGGHPDEFATLLDQLDDSVGVCLDTGHTALGHHWHRFLEVAGSRLAHIHANDNRGSWDDHLAPGDGILDWSGIVRSLEAVRFDGWIMLELKCPDGNQADYFRQAVLRTAELFGQSQG